MCVRYRRSQTPHSSSYLSAFNLIVEIREFIIRQIARSFRFVSSHKTQIKNRRRRKRRRKDKKKNKSQYSNIFEFQARKEFTLSQQISNRIHRFNLNAEVVITST